jgi:hypothetical protein
MTDRRPLGTPSFMITVSVVLLLMGTGFILLHSHKDWADHGCQLCHVRHLPSLNNAVTVDHGAPVSCQQNCNPENLAEELEAYVCNTSSRSPPAPISFSV